MCKLWNLCNDLAKGTLDEQERAWKILVLNGEVWQHCQAALQDFDQLEFLKNSYTLLSSPDTRNNARQSHQPANATQARQAVVSEADCFFDQTRRIVAAAVVAALGKFAASMDDVREELPFWAHRATKLTDLEQKLNFKLDVIQHDTSSKRVRAAYNEIKKLPVNSVHLAAASATTFMLLGQYQPTRRLSNIPLLFESADGSGEVMRLSVDLLPEGHGQFFPSPRMFRTLSTGFSDAITTAWKRAAIPRDCDVIWEIDGDDVPLDGPSAQAAMQVVLSILKDGDPYDSDCAISATVDGDGNLQHVAGIVNVAGNVTEHREAGPKLKAAKEKGVTKVVVSPDDHRALSENARYELEREGLVVLPAETIDDARDHASKLLNNLRELIQSHLDFVLEDASRRMKRDFGTFEQLDELFVPVRLARGLRPQLTQAEYEELERRRSQGDYSRLDDLEKQRPDLRDEKTQSKFSKPRETVAWEDVRDNMACGVVLGDPGYGKTMTLWHEVVRRCNNGLNTIRQEGARVRDLRFAVFVRAMTLADYLKSDHPSKPDQLLDVLLAEICKRQVDDQTKHVVRDKLKNGECLIAVDGLDEVPESLRENLNRALSVFVSNHPNAKLVASSRLVGYTTAPIPVHEDDELELLAFDELQMEQFVDAWFPNNLDAIAHFDSLSQQIRFVLRCPLLLRLACHSAEVALKRDQPLPDWQRRVELFETFLIDAVDQWNQRADPRPGREASGLLLKFAAEVCLELLKIDARRTIWLPTDISEVINRVRGSFHALNVRNDLLGDLCVAGLFVPIGADGPTTPLTYTHRSFAEYLAACSLAEQLEGNEYTTEQKHETWAFVDHKAWDPDWEQVIQLLAGCLTDPKPLLEMLSEENPTETNPHGDDFFRHRLGLAGRCAGEIEQNREMQPVIDNISNALYSRWWENNWKGTLAVVEHLSSGLPALVSKNGKINGMPVLERIQKEIAGNNIFAVYALEVIGAQAATPQVLEEIASLFQDRSNRFIAAKAAAALGRYAADPQILNCFVEILSEPKNDENSTTRYVVEECVRAMGRAATRDDGFMRSLSRLLDHPDDQVRAKAAWVFAGVVTSAPTDDGALDLAKCLQDGNEDVRSSAAVGSWGFGNNAPPKYLGEVTAQLTHEDAGVRSAAAESIGGIRNAGTRSEIVDGVVAMLRNGDRGPRVINALTKVPHALKKPGVPEIVMEMFFEQPSLHMRKIGRLITSVEPQMLKNFQWRIKEMLGDPTISVRKAALGALAWLGSNAFNEDTVQCLVDALNDVDADLRATSAKTLGRIGFLERNHRSATLEPFAIELVKLLNDNAQAVARAAAEAIGRIGMPGDKESVQTELARLLNDGEVDVQINVCLAIAKMGADALTPSIVDRLIELLQSDEVLVRIEAANALAQSRNPPTHGVLLDRLSELLRDSDRRVQYAGTELVRRISAIAAREDILDGLVRLVTSKSNESDEVMYWSREDYNQLGGGPLILNENIVHSAVDAIKALGTPQVDSNFTGHLTQLLRHEIAPIRSAAAYALANCGCGIATPELFDQLKELLNDEDRSVCDAGANALARFNTLGIRFLSQNGRFVVRPVAELVKC